MRLFVSFIRPYKAVTSSSSARWLKTILEEAGILLVVSRLVLAAAKARVSTGDILKAVNWNSELVFQRFIINQYLQQSHH